MKIVALQAENIKRLVAVEIKPDGNMVVISGRNASGKTSCLDSIWWALGGAAGIQQDPVRRGEKTGRIFLDLGDLRITRTFTRHDSGETTTSISVTSASGAKFNTPQTVLDDLLGQLTFDPLAFSRMRPREQFETLRRFVPDVDFDAIDRANEKDYNERTAVNRKAHEAQVYAEQIEAPKNVPARVDEDAIVKELAAASSHNSDIAKRKERRTGIAREIDQRMMVAADYEQQAKDLLVKAGKERTEAGRLQQDLTAAAPLPEPKDVTTIQTALAAAQDINAIVDLCDKRQALLAEAAQFNQASSVITDRMNARESDKQAKIAAAKLPVEGITFGRGCVMFKDLPLEQASDAEQLRISVAIAMALNPKLRVLRVRDGSLLDEESLKLLEQIVTDNDFQCWIERVDSSGTVGFVLEDGRLKDATAEKVS